MTSPSPAALLIATTNPFKAERWRRVLQDLATPVLPSDLGISVTVDEHATTTTQNARAKALKWCKISPVPVLADDLGLFLNALDGWPGVLMKSWGGQIPESATEGERMTMLDGTVRPLTDTTCYLETAIAVATPSGRIRQRTLRQYGWIDRTRTPVPHTSGPLLERVFIFDTCHKSWHDMTTSQRQEVDGLLRTATADLLRSLCDRKKPAPT